jgi:hypothetical protein
MSNELNFSAAVDDWCKENEARLLAVFKESSQRVVSLAVNGVPVDTGFARASIRASTSEMPQIDPNAKGGAYINGFDTVTLTIAGLELGATLYAGFTAAYIGPLEYGHSKQAPNGFVRIAAEQWPQIVSEVSAEAKARSQVQ